MKLPWPFGASLAAKQRAAERAMERAQAQQARSALETSREEFDYYIEKIRALISPYYRRIRSFPVLLNADTRRAIEGYHQYDLPRLRSILTELETHRQIPGFFNLQARMLAGAKLFVGGHERFYASLHEQTTQAAQFAYLDGQDMTKEGARMALLQREYPGEPDGFEGWEEP
jgi:hypothetical protein